MLYWMNADNEPIIDHNLPSHIGFHCFISEPSEIPAELHHIQADGDELLRVRRILGIHDTGMGLSLPQELVEQSYTDSSRTARVQTFNFIAALAVISRWNIFNRF